MTDNEDQEGIGRYTPEEVVETNPDPDELAEDE